MVPSRDPRLVRWTPLRDAATIRAEIQRLAVELEGTQPMSSARADAILALADAYGELANAIEKTTPHELEKCACDLPRGEALFFYRAFAKEYPDDPRIDSAMYFTAVERELARNASAAAELYQVLVAKEQSQFRSLAMFGLAEFLYIYADRPDEARRYYEKVLELPASPVLPDAILRLAQIAERTGDTATASALYSRLNNEFPSSDAALHGRSIP